MTREASCALLCKHQDFLSKRQLPVSGTRVVLTVGSQLLSEAGAALWPPPDWGNALLFRAGRDCWCTTAFIPWLTLSLTQGQRKQPNPPCTSFPVRGSAWVWASPRDSSTFREGSAQSLNQGQHQQPCWHMLQDELRITATGEAYFLSSCHLNANHTYTNYEQRHFRGEALPLEVQKLSKPSPIWRGRTVLYKTFKFQ